MEIFVTKLCAARYETLPGAVSHKTMALFIAAVRSNKGPCPWGQQRSKKLSFPQQQLSLSLSLSLSLWMSCLALTAGKDMNCQTSNSEGRSMDLGKEKKGGDFKIVHCVSFFSLGRIVL